LSKGKRTVKQRLTECQNKLQNGETELKLANHDFEMWVKYHKAFSHYALLCAKPRNFKTKVIVIQGATGVGKSRYAMDFDANAYWKPRGNWWDGYTGQDTCVIDEFYGWLPFDLLLRLCDRYPLHVEYKGGSVNFCSKTIIITSNKAPNNWYNNVYFDSLVRRVDQWIIMDQSGQGQIHNTYRPNLFINY